MRPYLVINFAVMISTATTLEQVAPSRAIDQGQRIFRDVSVRRRSRHSALFAAPGAELPETPSAIRRLDFSRDGLPSNGWTIFCGRKPTIPGPPRPPPPLGAVKLSGPASDLVYIHHIMKTGGTSFVVSLEKSFHSLLLPGTMRSNFFSIKRLSDFLHKAAEAGNSSTVDLYSRPWIASSHTSLGAFKTLVEKLVPGFIDHYKDGGSGDPNVPPPGPQDRILHHMTFVRHPVYLAASRYAEQQCGFMGGKLFDENCNFDLAAYRENYYNKYSVKCLANSEPKGEACRKGVADKAMMCSSSDIFANGKAQGILAGGMYFRHICASDTDDPAVDAAQAYTACYQRTVESLRTHLLVGVTERMEETACLFHYYTALPYTKPVGNDLYKQCRPISVWTQTAKDAAVRSSRRGWALYDAANTVMEERMAAATMELRRLASSGVDVESLPYIVPGCFDLKT